MTPLSAVANHVWQSSLFAAAAGLITLTLKNNRAQVRHWIWQAASVKFLVPFSWFVGIGSRFGSQTIPAVPALRLSLAIEKLGGPIAHVSPAPLARVPMETLILAVWLCGCLAAIAFWCLRWRRIAAVMRSASRLREGREFEILRSVQGTANQIDLFSSPSLLEPGIFGIFRPALLLPAGIADHLTTEQLRAILTHEVCHVRRQDNLLSAIHMLVECLFWFQPLVWWLGSRLVKEREQACDEEVLRLGTEPAVYASGILKVCGFYLESPLRCAAGVTGANLTERIEAIMRPRLVRHLNFGRKLLLAGSGIAAIAGPVMVGVTHASASAAMPSQTGAALSFDVASIKTSQRSKAGGEGRTRSTIDQSPVSLTLRNVSLSSCVELAYGVKFYQVSGPEWLKSERYDILAKSGAPSTSAQINIMLQTLLASRFKLALHRENRERPVYALVVAKNGPKLQHANDPGDYDTRVSDGSFIFQNVSMPSFAEKLSDLRTIDRPVVDHTGIPGLFDITLKSAARAMLETDGPSIFTLVQEQLGLKLEPIKAPVEILIVDHAERVPTEN